MKRWLKYGLIGAGIYFFFFLVLLIIDIISVQKLAGTSDRMPFFIFAAAPGIYFLRFLGARIGGGIWLLSYVLVSILLFFLIGAIIGLIVNKLKKRKEDQNA